MAGIGRMAVLGVVLAVVSTACTGGVGGLDDLDGAAGLDGIRDPVVRAQAEAVALRAFADCREARDYFREQASAHMDAYGYAFARGPMGFRGGLVPLRGAAERGGLVVNADAIASDGGLPAPIPAPSMPDAAEPGSFSTTNVQEAGVDEADSIKTDGEHVFVLRADRVVAVEVTGEELREAGSIRIAEAWGAQLLLAGERLLVVSPNPYVEAEPARGQMPWRARTALHVVDVSDPGDMRLVETLWVEGSYVSARMVGGIARVVVRTGGPALDIVYPADGSPRSIRIAEATNRTAVARSLVSDWIPRYTRATGSAFPAGEGAPLTPCDGIRRPKEFSGLEMVSVITVDPADPTPREAATVVGTGDTVYASPTSLYVTTNRWEDDDAARPALRAPGIRRAPGITRVPSGSRAPSQPKLTTQIHRFDITDPEQARYVASGEVDGHLLNQWSLSEHDGHLRVVTTLNLWSPDSESQVVVLRQRGPLLRTVGSVGGLGLTERVYAVRFMGTLGYVVTFREVDPLYVIDLSDPEDPRVRGELKIPGFSSYLHPVGEGLLVGIGQDATLEGRLLGVQASLFDVSDPTSPTQLDKVRFGQGYTTVQRDHRAFTWWGPERLALFPVVTSGRRGEGGARAQALRVGDAELTRAGEIRHPTARHRPIERVLVIGDAIYTVSTAGILASDLDTFDERDWLRWTR